MTRIDGHGTVTLPAGYVAEHVQLGYAATEPGNQSDTTTASITLATNATTCRGLYVGMTRGRQRNDVHVVTDTHNPGDAIDVLEQILGSDRADTPAIRTRRELATQPPPAPKLEPRCEIPDWVNDLEHDAQQRAADARHRLCEFDEADHAGKDRVAQIDRRLDALAPLCAPYDDAIVAAGWRLDAARLDAHRASAAHTAAGRLHRRSSRRDYERALDRVATAERDLHDVQSAPCAPVDERRRLGAERERLHGDVSIRRVDRRRTERHVDLAAGDLAAIAGWVAWARGRPVDVGTLARVAEHLDHASPIEALLAKPLHDWLHHHHGITPPADRSVAVAVVEPERSRGVGIEL